ncbi:MAG: late competence development ComFB family protein [Treponema sp.]|jgi:competence protein ComFB|nr:late competence development ComFB family protein [Treponema sp.]
MEIHNTTEDLVFSTIDAICSSIEKQGNPDKLCLCDQCRIDAACFVLNRIPPHYIISNRGAARIEQVTISWQQKEADVVSMVFEALKRVSHNQRPNSDHSNAAPGDTIKQGPVFNIPTIIGRAFDGADFSPLAGITVELWREGKLVKMKNRNWQNPCILVANTQGAFTFWPESISADAANTRENFEYSVRIEANGFETMNHFFSIPVISEPGDIESFSMDRTFKLPDLYLFPPGGDED